MRKRSHIVISLSHAETTFGLENMGIRGGTTPLPGLLR